MYNDIDHQLSRRDFLLRTSCGFGAVALQTLLAQQATATDKSVQQSRYRTHHQPRAKRLLFIYLSGGPSQMDLFDYKPELEKRHGQKVPFALPSNETSYGLDNIRLMGPLAKFKQHGESGLWMSNFLPQLSKCVDDLCYLPATVTDNQAHHPAHLQIHTGVQNAVRPSYGAWLNYGLGSENQNLPGFVTIGPVYDDRAFGNGFLPASLQGTPIRTVSRNPKKYPVIRDLINSKMTAKQQREQLDLLSQLNHGLTNRHGADADMEGMIKAFELGFRMQTEMPAVADFTTESKTIRNLYGSSYNGLKALLARRLLEKGVRCVQLTLSGWDHHRDIRKTLPKQCLAVDQPAAALLTDLKKSGLLNDTLVVIKGEFGRTPWSQDGAMNGAGFESQGRDHNPHGYTTILAGAGVKRGYVHGATDEFSFRAIDGKVHIHDLHATMLHLMGLDHKKLTYHYAGRDYRLTDVYGNVVHDVIDSA